MGSGTQPANDRRSDALASLNARLKNSHAGSDVDYSPTRVALGGAQRIFNDAMAAYEARFAPPPDILRRTFGFMYARRALREPDSVAYVFDTYSIGPIRMCKAWRIVEHPYQPVRETGAVAGNAGIGGAVVTPRNSADVRHDSGSDPDVGIVQFPCSATTYTPVSRGSLTTPLPLHPGQRATELPAATPTPP